MALALKEARAAGTLGDRAIGCVIAHDGAVISHGRNAVYTRLCELEHAEIGAIRSGYSYLESHAPDCVLYVTLEPCAMCIGADDATHCHSSDTCGFCGVLPHVCQKEGQQSSVLGTHGCGIWPACHPVRVYVTRKEKAFSHTAG